MFLSRTARLFIVSFIILAAWTFTASAQEPSAGQAKFWKGFHKTYAAGDEKKTLNYIRRNKESAVETFDFYFIAFATNSATNVEEADLKALATTMQEVFKNSLYTYKVDSFLDLEPAGRQSWGNAWGMFVTGYAAFTEGKDNDNPYKTGEAMEKYEKSLEIFRYLEDHLAEIDLLVRLSECSELVQEKYRSCVFLHEAKAAIDKLPLKHNEMKMMPDNVELITTKLQEYLDKGYDPTKPQYDGGEPTEVEVEEGGEELVDDGSLRMPSFVPVDPDAPYEEWKMSYAKMKGPDDFFTPAYFTGYNLFLWPRIWYDSGQSDSVNMNPFYMNNVYYYGFYAKPLMLTYADDTFFVEIDGNKRTRSEVKATTKAGKLVIKDVEKGPDGKYPECQMFIQTPGEQESMFGLTVNNADQDVKRLNLRMRVGWYTKGKIHGETCMLIDDNISGTLNELGYPMESDTLTNGDYIHWYLDAMVVGKEKKARPVSNYMRFGDKFYHMKIDPYGRKVETKEVEVETGTIRFNWKGDTMPEYVILHLLDDNYFFVNVAQKDPVEVPIGQYEIACGKIETKKKKNAKQVRIYNGSHPYIEVYKNKQTTLTLGAPFKFTFETEIKTGEDTESGNDEFVVIGKSLNVFGRGGEAYAMFFDEVPLPEVSIRDKETQTVVAKGEEMRAADLDRFYFFDRNSVWFPMDYGYEIKATSELEAKLELKKIPLLGGPAESEWLE